MATSAAEVVCSNSVVFTGILDVERTEVVSGVTKLRNEIYVVVSLFSCVISVFDDRNPFRLQKKIKAKEIKTPWDLVSDEKENCLYLSDYCLKCVWKITRGKCGRHKIIKWLTTDYQPLNMSVNGVGQLLVTSFSSSVLRIYGSDAELIRSIQSPKDIEEQLILHAVETSIGNLFILHSKPEMEKEEESGLNGRRRYIWGISELTRDGQMANCRFIPSNKTEAEMLPSQYLSLDSDDRVIVADHDNGGVILLDSNLKWNRILCPTKEEPEETRISWSERVFYDEAKKQLIVAGYGVNVYNLI